MANSVSAFNYITTDNLDPAVFAKTTILSSDFVSTFPYEISVLSGCTLELSTMGGRSRTVDLSSAIVYGTPVNGGGSGTIPDFLIKDGNYNAVDKDQIFANVDSDGAFSITLPGEPTVGMFVRITGNSFATYNVTVLAPLIEGEENFLIDLNNADITFVFIDGGTGWKVSSNLSSVANDGSFLPLAGGTMDDSAIIGFSNGSGLKMGTTDQSQGGYKGISLLCSAAYELNYQAGYLTNYQPNGSSIRDLPLKSDLTFVDTKINDGNGNVSMEPCTRVLKNASGGTMFDWNLESPYADLPNPGGSYITLQEGLETNNAASLPQDATRKVMINIDSILSIPDNGRSGQRITYLIYNNTGGSLQLTLDGIYHVLPDGLVWGPTLLSYRERRVTVEHNGWAWNILPYEDFYWD